MHGVGALISSSKSTLLMTISCYSLIMEGQCDGVLTISDLVFLEKHFIT